MAAGVPRALHPLAWWGWAVGLAISASVTTNPLLLALVLGVATLVVQARRSDSPWARAFRLYVGLGLFIIAFRLVMHVLVGFKTGTVLVLPLPKVSLPHWAAGINLLGNVYLDGLLAAFLQGVQLATLVIAIGAANALANPKRLLRALPNALHEVGTAVVVAVSVAPQLAESVQRVMRARVLRGDVERGLRAVPRVALPVLQDTLDRSLLLAAAMESRGYGRRTDPAPGAATTAAARTRTATGLLTLGGLLAVALGMYGVLAPGGSGDFPVLAVSAVAGGVAAALAGLVIGGRQIQVTTYRPDPWRWPETLTVACGAAAAGMTLLDRKWHADLLLWPPHPVSAPHLPLLSALGILLAALPAYLTPAAPTGRGQR